MNGPPGSTINAAVVKSFEAAHPNIRVKLIAAQSGTTLAKFDTMAAAGDPPSVYNANSFNFSELLGHGVPSPVMVHALGYKTIGELKAAYLPGVFSGYTSKGVVYGVPEELSNYLAWVNTSDFTKAGVAVPHTWAQVCADGPKLLKTKGGKVIQEEISLPTTFAAEQSLVVGAVAEEYGAPLFNAAGTKTYLTSKAALDAFTMLQNLVYKCHASVPALNSSKSAADRVVYGDGQSAMFLSGGSWWLGVMKKTYPKVAPLSRPYEYPAGPGGKTVNPSYGYAWIVPGAARNKAAAWEFVRALASSGVTWLSKEGLFNGTKAVSTSSVAKSEPYWQKVWAPSLSRSSYAVSLKNSAQIDKVIGSALDEVLLSHANVTATLSAAKRQVVPLLNKAKG